MPDRAPVMTEFVYVFVDIEITRNAGVPRQMMGDIAHRIENFPGYPSDLTDGTLHTHRALDDARGHASLYFNARRRVISR